MLRYLAFGITLTAIIVGAQLYRTTDPAAIAPETLAVTEPVTAQATQTHHQLATSQTSTSAPQPLGTRPVEAEAPLETAMTANEVSQEPIEVWQEDPEPPVLPVRFSNKGIDARPLKIAKQQFQQVGVGDRLALPIPQTNQSFEMSIKQVGQHKNGDKTLKGHLTAQPEYAVVVTEGRNATYATISTPEGSFMLEAEQEQGWLVAANDLDALIDPNLTDYQIPNINRNPNP